MEVEVECPSDAIPISTSSTKTVIVNTTGVTKDYLEYAQSIV